VVGCVTQIEFPCEITGLGDLQIGVAFDQLLRAVILKADGKLSFFALALDIYDRAHAVFRVADARADQH
jgi:hypothetical protein